MVRRPRPRLAGNSGRKCALVYHCDGVAGKSFSLRVHLRQALPTEKSIVLAITGRGADDRTVPLTADSWPVSRVLGTNYVYLGSMSSGLQRIRDVEFVEDVLALRIDVFDWSAEPGTAARSIGPCVVEFRNFALGDEALIASPRNEAT